jgi:anhydro-N-acetylmuramic acid kinase
MNNESYVVGLMSGTSLDGIDAALVKISGSHSGEKVDLVHSIQLPFSKSLKTRLLTLCDPNEVTVEDISVMNVLLGEMFAEAALQVIDEADVKRDEILLIGSHGQTIFHQPVPQRIEGRMITSTLQIGDISVIAEKTGIPVAGDFRPRDMAAGGQGAPLVPFADYDLFKEQEIGRVLVNIGGIANITVLPAGCEPQEVLAYDTGPGNMMMDEFVSLATNGENGYDHDGRLAAKGEVNAEWLRQLLQHDYFSAEAPKSTGREMFGREYAHTLWEEADKLGVGPYDKVATITELTAVTIAAEINKAGKASRINEVLVSGGGAWNGTLMSRLDFHLSEGIICTTTDPYGMPVDAKESMVFALLGYLCYYQKVNNLPAATGASRQVVMGKIAW